MFGPKEVKQHLNRIIDDIDAGRSPSRHRAPWWVRKLAGPAALGLAFGLGAACTTEDPGATLTREEVEQGKADGFDDVLCELIGAEPGCDLCEELDWYGDGYCDDFCDEPDPDCGAIALYAAPPIDCETDEQCPDGMECVEHTGECPPGAYCILPPSPGTCQPVEDEGCTTDDDCDDGERCIGAVGECPEGAFCILPPTPGTCEPVTQCNFDDDCDEGEQCVNTITGECPEGAYCILPPYTGECRPIIECSEDADCPDDMHCEETGSDCPPGAFCILPPTPGTCQPDED